MAENNNRREVNGNNRHSHGRRGNRRQGQRERGPEVDAVTELLINLFKNKNVGGRQQRPGRGRGRGRHSRGRNSHGPGEGQETRPQITGAEDWGEPLQIAIPPAVADVLRGFLSQVGNIVDAPEQRRGPPQHKHGPPQQRRGPPNQRRRGPPNCGQGKQRACSKGKNKQNQKMNERKEKWKNKYKKKQEKLELKAKDENDEVEEEIKELTKQLEQPKQVLKVENKTKVQDKVKTHKAREDNIKPPKEIEFVLENVDKFLDIFKNPNGPGGLMTLLGAKGLLDGVNLNINPNQNQPTNQNQNQNRQRAVVENKNHKKVEIKEEKKLKEEEEEEDEDKESIFGADEEMPKWLKKNDVKKSKKELIREQRMKKFGTGKKQNKNKNKNGNKKQNRKQYEDDDGTIHIKQKTNFTKNIGPFEVKGKLIEKTTLTPKTKEQKAKEEEAERLKEKAVEPEEEEEGGSNLSRMLSDLSTDEKDQLFHILKKLMKKKQKD